ncbi:MAG: GHMP kinase, partial [Methanothrix sp.]
FEIYRYMSILRDADLEFVGMSSVGPSIAIVTERNRDEVAKIIEPVGLEIAVETKVDNIGLTIRVD